MKIEFDNKLLSIESYYSVDKIKKYFSFGKNNEVTKATANIVEVCPEGKE